MNRGTKAINHLRHFINITEHSAQCQLLQVDHLQWLTVC